MRIVPSNRKMPTSRIVEIDGHSATCASYLTRIDHGGQGPFFWSFGRYLDTFRRCEDG